VASRLLVAATQGEVRMNTSVPPDTETTPMPGRHGSATDQSAARSGETCRARDASDTLGSRPLILAGMHRSGTSLTASLLASAGVHMGERLLGAYPGNPLGHFEDLGFFEFHKQALHAVGDDPDGFSARAITVLPSVIAARADELVAERAAAGRLWGWKDPRTTLFLDFWAERVPGARFLLVFRNPAHVADSLFRRGDELFARDPFRALTVWKAYNELIVDFASRHPDRCLVVDIEEVTEDPNALCGRIRGRFGLPLGNPKTLFRADLFGGESNSQRTTVALALAPEVFDVYDELRRLAETRASHRRTAAAATVHMLLIREWARASRAETVLKEALAATRQLQADLDSALSRVSELEADRLGLDRIRASVPSWVIELGHWIRNRIPFVAHRHDARPRSAD
jgi:hypothetical protein